MKPTERPTNPAPTKKPTAKPTERPTKPAPTPKPTAKPTMKPTEKPVEPRTNRPTEKHTERPTQGPPSKKPTAVRPVKETTTKGPPPTQSIKPFEALKPNIIIFFIDDLGWNDVSFHGSKQYPTPIIDGLMRDGLHLNNYYVQAKCTPSRASLLTGRYPSMIGMHDALSGPATYGLPLDLFLLPQDLKRAGYDTHIVGKWHLGFWTPAYVPTARGFDSFYGYYNNGEDYNLHDFFYQTTLHGYDLRRNNHPISRPHNYSTYMYGNESLDIMKNYAKPDANPFFLYLAIQAVHTPLTAPDEVLAKFGHITNPVRRKMAAMATVLDNVIGELVGYMKDTGMWDNTMIIFSTDNGGDQTGASGGNNFPLRGSKGTDWEGGIRGVAFITGGWLPDERRGQTMRSLMHISDWYPTLCRIADVLPTPATLDGVSQYANIMEDRGDPYGVRDEILLGMERCDEVSLGLCGSLRWKKYKLISIVGITAGDPCRHAWCPPDDDPRIYEGATVKCASDGSFRYPTPTNSMCCYNGEPCLFDLEADPCEYEDIRYQLSGTYEQMRAKFLEYEHRTVEPISNYAPEELEEANPEADGKNGFWCPWHFNRASDWDDFQ